MPVTRTFARLHFSDLDPMRFEDLGLNIISRLYPWNELNHFGRSGADGGADFWGSLEENGTLKQWLVQCKRYKDFKKAHASEIISRISGYGRIPDKLLVIVSADVSRAVYEMLRSEAHRLGITEMEIWSASRLEALLYEKFPDLLFIYFGVSPKKHVENDAARIRYSLKMEKKVFKELIDHEFAGKQPLGYFMYNPSHRFISSRVVIRSAGDITYPNYDDPESKSISPWFRACIYDTYHNGIELWLNPGVGEFILMDQEGAYEFVERNDPRAKMAGYALLNTRMIGRIPYHEIVDIKRDGDEYYSEPHIFCKFSFDGQPYEKIYHKRYGDPEKEIPDFELDLAKQTKFPPAAP